jgi:Tetratricopeptide repeat
MSSKTVRPSTVCSIILLSAAAMFEGCMPPPQSYRTSPVLPSTSASQSAKKPDALTAPAPAQETTRRPLPEEAKIREQDLKKPAAPVLKDNSRDARGVESRSTPEALGPALRDDSSLLAKITPGISPQRAASIRLTEEGRKLLDAGDPNRALSRLEKTIVIDSTNPYGYFYLAKTHYRLGRYKESLNFLDVAESRLNGEPFWLAEVYALRGENLRALGMIEKAESSYNHALSLNSGNRTASDALSRLQGDMGVSR